MSSCSSPPITLSSNKLSPTPSIGVAAPAPLSRRRTVALAVHGPNAVDLGDS